MNSPGAAAASCNMKYSGGGGMKKQYAWSWRSHDRDQLFHTTAIFVGCELANLLVTHLCWFIYWPSLWASHVRFAIPKQGRYLALHHLL